MDKSDININKIRISNQYDTDGFNYLNFDDQSLVEKGKSDISFSMISDNIDEINHIIGKIFFILYKLKFN